MIETEERTQKLEEIPYNSKRNEYVHKNPSPESISKKGKSIFQEGDLVGYDGEGNLWVVETEGWEYHDIEGNQNKGEFYLHYTVEALNLEVAGYLNPDRRLHEENFATGEDLYQAASHNLEDIDRMLNGREVQFV